MQYPVDTCQLAEGSIFVRDIVDSRIVVLPTVASVGFRAPERSDKKRLIWLVRVQLHVLVGGDVDFHDRLGWLHGVGVFFQRFEQQLSIETRQPAFFTDECHVLDAVSFFRNEVETLRDVVEIRRVLKQEGGLAFPGVRPASK